MGLRLPESMDECVYFTQRTLADTSEVMAWVFKQDCPKCGKAPMGKPKGKDGKVKTRAKEYVCPECEHTVEKQEYEDTLKCAAQFTCGKCGKEGEQEIPFQRKNIDGVPTLRFTCQCGNTIDVTKKMKEKKGKKSSSDDF